MAIQKFYRNENCVEFLKALTLNIFNELKTKIGARNLKEVSAVKAVSDWAKENPGKASAAVAVLTVAAGMAGGPLGGAIGGFLARATKDLLKGENLSTAVGSSLKTAAIGAVVGALGDAVSADVTLILPDGVTDGYYLQTNSTGTLTWALPQTQIANNTTDTAINSNLSVIDPGKSTSGMFGALLSLLFSGLLAIGLRFFKKGKQV